MERSDLLPEIFYDETTDSTELEQFQNKFLRGILKYQHNHLKAFVEDCCLQVNPGFMDLNGNKRKQFLTQQIQNNQPMRNQCLGLIVGFLEEKEFLWYLKNRSDCNKRILQMVLKRLVD